MTSILTGLGSIASGIVIGHSAFIVLDRIRYRNIMSAVRATRPTYISLVALTLIATCLVFTFVGELHLLVHLCAIYLAIGFLRVGKDVAKLPGDRPLYAMRGKTKILFMFITLWPLMILATALPKQDG